MARRNVIQFSVEVIDKASRNLTDISGKIARFAKQAAVAASAMAVAFGLAAKKAINAADQIAKTAKVVGLSAESLQEFRFAAQQMGIANIGVDDSMRRMQRRMGEFINSGAGPAKLAMEGLGISITNAAGQFVGTEEAFFRSVDAISKLGSVAEQSAVAAQLFGDDFGPKLVPLLALGRTGIEELRQEARDLGIVMSDEAAANAEKAQDAFARLANVISSKVIQAFANNAEAIETTVTLLVDLAIKIFDTIDAFAKFTGLADKGIEELQTGIAGLIAHQAELIRQYGDDAMEGTLYKALEAQIQTDIEKIRELQKLQDLSSRTGQVGGDGGGFSFNAPGTNPLEGFLAGFDTAEMQRSAALMKLRKAMADGLVPTQAEANRIRQAIIDKYTPAIEELEITTNNRTGKLTDGLTTSFDFMASAAEGAAQQMQSAFTDFFLNMDSGVKGMLRAFIDAIRQMIAQVLAFQTLKFFGVEKVFKSLLGRASGGVVQGGRPYIVGERGPELFVPDGGGRIMPNAALRGTDTGQQFITNIDARGADPGLIARLPQILEQRDKRLLLAVQKFAATGVMPT